MKLLVLSVLLAFGFAAQSATATPLYFGAHYQWAQDLGPSSFKDNADPANGFGLLGGYKLTDKWAAEIGYDRFKFGNVDMTHSLFAVSGVYRFTPGFQQGFIVPFARLGLGVAENSFDASGVPNKTTFAGHVGGGAEFNFKPVTVYAGARWNYLGKISESVKDANSLNLMVGIILPAFGDDSTKAVSQPTAEVAKVAAVEAKPVDSDGDGVNDDKDKCPNTPAGTKVNAYGCAEKEKAVIKINIEFLAGKTDVQPQYEAEIEKLAAFMKEHSKTKVEIAGHTDNSGSAKLNMSLSKKRAQSVADVLVKKHGISKARVTSKGYGPSKPIADNNTAEGRTTNRRVEAQISN